MLKFEFVWSLGEIIEDIFQKGCIFIKKIISLLR